MDQTLKTNCLKESRGSHTCVYNRLRYSDSVESDCGVVDKSLPL